MGWVLKSTPVVAHTCARPDAAAGITGDIWTCPICGAYWLVRWRGGDEYGPGYHYWQQISERKAVRLIKRDRNRRGVV